MVGEQVGPGDLPLTDDFIFAALQQRQARQTIGRLWDEGIASGHTDPNETIDDIKVAAQDASR